MESCKYCGKECKNSNSWRNHERLCRLNPDRQATYFMTNKDHKRSNQFIKAKELGHQIPDGTNKGKPAEFFSHPHSEESKKKISEGVKKAHDEGRGHTWVHRPDSPSYAEQWLYKFLDERCIVYEKEKPFFGFFLDVAIGNKCIEMDGEQHYDTKKFPEQIERDKRKEKLLEEKGWQLLRIRWAEYKKNPAQIIKALEDFLEM